MNNKLIMAMIAFFVMAEISSAYNFTSRTGKIEEHILSESRKGLRQGNEPFLLKGIDNGVGVLLFHGFTASPWEVKELGTYLNEQENMTVFGPLLAGHGTSPEDLKSTKWEDWYRSANESYNMMKDAFGCVYVGGMSTGSSLALMLAMEHDVCGIISIATPIIFQGWLIRYTKYLKYFVPYTERLVPESMKPYYYEKRPTAAVAQLYKMVQIMRKSLYKIDEPIIIIQSLKDQTIEPFSAEVIMTNISSEDKTFIWFDEGSHVIIKDAQRDEVFKLIKEFIESQEKKNNHG